MSDFKKLDIKSPVDVSNIDDLKSQAYDRIMSDPIIHKYIIDNEIPLEFVNNNLGLFVRMEEENRPCAKCKSYRDCKKENNTKGYCAFVDEFENITYRKCKRYEEFLEIANRYVYRDFDEQDVYIDLKDINLVDPETKRLAGTLSKCLKSKTSIYVYSKDNLEVVSKLFKWITNSSLKGDYKVAYINATTLEEMVERYNRFDKDKLYKFEEMIKTVDILVINGMGNENSTFNTDYYKYSYLMDLMTYREQHKLLTFISSYYSLAELKEVFGGNSYNLRSKTELLIKKINEHCATFEFNTLVRQ